MTPPYQHPTYQPPPRKLTRSTTDKYVGGVCGGLARYLNMDATLVRILTVVLTLVTGGAPVIVYLIALFLMPEDTRIPPTPPSVPGAPTHDPTASEDVWGPAGAPWTSSEAQPSRVQDPPAQDAESGPNPRL